MKSEILCEKVQHPQKVVNGFTRHRNGLQDDWQGHECGPPLFSHRSHCGLRTGKMTWECLGGDHRERRGTEMKSMRPN